MGAKSGKEAAMNAFGNFLYSLRKARGMTQQELADRLDVTNKAVSKWETGEAFPETAQLVPIADIFGVTVDELLRGCRTEKEAPMSEGAPSGGRAEGRGVHTGTYIVLFMLAGAAILFSVVYLLAACLAEEVAHREAVVRASVCLVLMAAAFAGCCIAGALFARRAQRARTEEVRRAFVRLAWMSSAAILLLMLGVCCFVFFSLFATQAYYHASALIAGMAAGGAFVLGGGGLLAAGGCVALSRIKRGNIQREGGNG